MGIDPGLAGGVALLAIDGDGGPVTVALRRTPTLAVRTKAGTRREYNLAAMVATLRELGNSTRPQDTLVAVERSGARPRQGVTSMFRTGYGAGLWIGMITALGLPLVLVSPASWKRHMGLLHADKRASRLLAAQRYPVVGPLEAADEGPAEALLIATFVLETRRTPLGEGRAFGS